VKRFGLRIEDKLHEQLRKESYKNNISMNDILIEMLEERYKKKK